jgi:chromosomal replication initiation ATPase DnaA
VSVPDVDTSVLQLDPRPPGGMKAILEATAADWGMKASDILSGGRSRDVVYPRFDFMHRARSVTWENGKPRYSTPQIASFLGMEDHTSVLHGLRQFKRGVVSRAFVDRQVQDILNASRFPYDPR